MIHGILSVFQSLDARGLWGGGGGGAGTGITITVSPVCLGFVQEISAELLNLELFLTKLVGWCTIMSWSAIQNKSWVAIIIVGQEMIRFVYLHNLIRDRPVLQANSAI